MKNRETLTPNSFVTLDADMSLIPGCVDDDPSILRLSRNPGREMVTKGQTATFLGYKKLSINGREKRQLLIRVNGLMVWAYRDHVHQAEGVDEQTTRAMLIARWDELNEEMDRIEAQL